MGPFVVGLSGGTASGKSTIVAAAAVGLGATVIAHDRYYFDAPDPRGHDFDRPEALETALLVEHLARLRAGEAVEIPVYDFATHRRSSATERLQPGTILVVEGILVLCDPAIRRLCDLTVYVHADDDVRLARRIERDMRERGRTLRSVLDQWFGTVRPAHRAWVEPCRALVDVVLDGEGPAADAVARLAAALPR